MRIRYIFATTKPAAEVARRQDKLNGWAGPGTRVEAIAATNAPRSIESAYDGALAVPELLENALAAERDGFEAVIISCFGDPGLTAARELVSIPVIGSCECALHVASQLGSRFSILSPLDGLGAEVAERPRALGLESKFASVRGIGLSVLDLNAAPEETFGRLESVGRAAVEEDGADVLVLGCMSMAFQDSSGVLSDKIGVPVVNPVPATIRTAEMLVSMGLAQSKKAYPTPPKLAAQESLSAAE